MKKSTLFLLAATLVFLFSIRAYSQPGRRGKIPDTNGVADIESSIEDFKPFVQSLINRIPVCSSLDSIQFMASPVVLLGDSLLNHISRVYDGFNALHPDQYIPIENLSDDLDHVMDTKTLDKARKYNQKMIVEYNNLIKAK